MLYIYILYILYIYYIYLYTYILTQIYLCKGVFSRFFGRDHKVALNMGTPLRTYQPGPK